MAADPRTLFSVLVASTTVGTLLLLWCWWQNRAERVLMWSCAAYFSGSVAILLMTARGILPEWITTSFAVAVTMWSVGLIWIAGRVFNRLPAKPWLALVGPAVWLIASELPQAYVAVPVRVSLAAVITAAYALISAREFARADGLSSRYPVAVILGLHGIAVILRIPFAFALPIPHGLPLFSDWFSPVAIEGIVFSQIIGLLVVMLTRERLELQLRAIALTDPLTGLNNRRAIFERGHALLSHGSRHRRPVSVVALDLDHFKTINDRFGHPTGDAVLAAFADAIRQTLRAGDESGRIGGEEFLCVLPDTDADQAFAAAHRLVTHFTRLAADVPGCRTRCTASAGIATSSLDTDTFETLVSAADVALYEAKRSGGEKIIVASPRAISA